MAAAITMLGALALAAVWVAVHHDSSARCGGRPGVATPGNDDLNGVAVSSATSAWAVGSQYFQTSQELFLTLIEHWNGHSWSRVLSPNPAGSTDGAANILTAAAATSPSNAWAVGTYAVPGRPSRTLIEHWDGTCWQQAVSPSPAGASSAELKSVAATSATNAWVVGNYNTSHGDQRALIEHWDGTSWRQVQAPSPRTASLNAVAVASPSSAWAAGSFSSPEVFLPVRALIEHWNGASWQLVASPNPGGPVVSNLLAVATASRSTVWAAGSLAKRPGRSVDDRNLTERWNGREWRQVPAPTGRPDLLLGVAATSAGRAWAVGSDEVGTLALLWNGVKWVRVPSILTAFGHYAALCAVAAVRSAAWAVGSYDTDSKHTKTLIERWTGRRWQQVPSPSP